MRIAIVKAEKALPLPEFWRGPSLRGSVSSGFGDLIVRFGSLKLIKVRI